MVSLLCIPTKCASVSIPSRRGINQGRDHRNRFPVLLGERERIGAVMSASLVLLLLPCAKIKNVLRYKLHISLDAADAVRQDSHLHGTVRPAGEEVIGRTRFDLHDACAEVAEEGLAGVFVAESV